MSEMIEAEVERLRTLAHDAPLNIFHKDHDGHCWVEVVSYAWRDRSNEYMAAQRLCAALSEHKEKDGR